MAHPAVLWIIRAESIGRARFVPLLRAIGLNQGGKNLIFKRVNGNPVRRRASGCLQRQALVELLVQRFNRAIVFD
ncbi:MAG: hypothetical protein B7X64_12220 [Halothiobacillus sp. 39-53-45]|nr:MAG: hypothetical protein B7X64_12220 [Halothiobacillus sp. 39-53-45]